MADMRAFPSTAIDPAYGGLTKREWYAGKALQGFLADGVQRQIAAELDEDPNAPDDTRERERIIHALIAESCFDMADAMVAEGERRS